MNRPIQLLHFFKGALILLATSLYLLAPLHQPLADGFHKLEHTLLNTNSNHSHDLAHDHEIEHAHDHKILAFFNTLFEENTTNNDEQLSNPFELDKHIVSQYPQPKYSHEAPIVENFNYKMGAYSVSRARVLPPPER